MLAAVILGVVFLLGQPGITAETRAQAAKSAKAGKVAAAKKKAGRIAKALGLTEEQKSRIKAIRRHFTDA